MMSCDHIVLTQLRVFQRFHVIHLRVSISIEMRQNYSPALHEFIYMCHCHNVQKHVQYFKYGNGYLNLYDL